MKKYWGRAMAEMKKNLGFEITPTEYVLYSSFDPNDNKWGLLTPMSWKNKGFWPSPMSAGLNYGVSIFEGMKAFRHKSEEIFLFRARDHAERLGESLRRLLVPDLPAAIFLEAVQILVEINAKFVPKYRQGSLYIRPIVYGNNKLGVAFQPDLAYTAAFWCSPVGAYYADGLKPIGVNVEKNITRAMPGGVGCCKVSGNYIISRIAQFIAKQKGCQDALFLDGKNKKYIEELGAANVFAVKDNVLYTPRLKDTILPGITRKSIITLAKSELHMEVCERNVTVRQLINADEAFATGTAAVVTPIGRIRDGDYDHNIYTVGNGEVGPITRKLYDLLTDIQYGDIPDSFGWLIKVV